MRTNIVARAAVAVVGCLVLLAATVPAAGAFLSALASDDPTVADTSKVGLQRKLDRLHHAQFECMRDAVDAQLPPGVPVVISVDPAAPEPALWEQRLMEFAFPVAPVVADPGPGVTRLRVVADDTGTGCTGVLLIIERG